MIAGMPASRASLGAGANSISAASNSHRQLIPIRFMA
jgi:hypothetical protein